MTKINERWFCALLLLVSMTAGCSSRSASSSAASEASSAVAAESSTTPAAPGSPSSSPYPAWASAAVPDYPNFIDQILVRDDFFQIDSADDSATVVAWYKSHVAGSWGTAGSPDNVVFPNANGVRIEIDKIGYGNQPVGNRPRTIVCLNRFVDGQAQPC